MPELPEITYMINNIKKFKGKKLKEIVFSKYSKYYKKDIKNLDKIIFPNKIKNIFNIGKRIFIILTGNYHIIMNMGMSGNLSKSKDEKYNSIIFNLTNNRSFYMNDLRKFGTMRIVNNIDKYINELGYDPYYHNISFEKFYEKYIEKKKSKQLLAFKLMDQSIFAGLGNYLRAEILYDTKIDPFCIFDNVPKKYWEKIYKSYKKMTYKYYYVYNFKAYGRTDKKNIIQKKINGRTLWYDPSRIIYKC